MYCTQRLFLTSEDEIKHVCNYVTLSIDRSSIQFSIKLLIFCVVLLYSLEHEKKLYVLAKECIILKVIYIVLSNFVVTSFIHFIF